MQRMGYTSSNTALSATASRSVEQRATSGSAAMLEVTVFCHSYPSFRGRAQIIDWRTLRISCDLRPLPEHTYLELRLEIPASIKTGPERIPIYVVDLSEVSCTFQYAFDDGPDLLEVLRLQQCALTA